MRQKTKVKRSYTLTDNADELLVKMAKKNGLSKSAVIEIAIRNEAERQGVSLESKS